MTPPAFEGNEPQRDRPFTGAVTGSNPILEGDAILDRLARASDNRARETAATDQETGKARSLARMSAAFFLEAVRAGVPQGEAVTITGEYIRAQMQDWATQLFIEKRTERGPLDQ